MSRSCGAVRGHEVRKAVRAGAAEATDQPERVEGEDTSEVKGEGDNGTDKGEGKVGNKGERKDKSEGKMRVMIGNRVWVKILVR